MSMDISGVFSAEIEILGEDIQESVFEGNSEHLRYISTGRVSTMPWVYGSRFYPFDTGMERVFEEDMEGCF